MSPCFNGSILHVDLTKKELWVEHPPEEFYRTYGGSSAMGLYYILRDVPANADPLGPENVLTLFSGVPTGLAVSGQSRLSANARSPISGAIGDSQCGGFFPAHLKFAGFDGIVIRGQSESPVYLWIHNGEAELRDASHVWGMLTADAEEVLKKELDAPRAEVLQIGPAGEKLVRFAAIMNMHNRANGRTGMGAVMGSKKLKAVVVSGNKKMTAADSKKIAALQKLGTANIDVIPDMKSISAFGTPDVIPFQHSYGTLPTYNYNHGQFENYMDLSGERMADTILVERDTCYACTVRCKRVVETEYKGQKVLPTYGGPEYETLATMGSYCGVNELSAVALGNQLCNAYGMDTIACGATIAFAMECFENGILTKEDTDGIDLKFGNADALVELIEKIGKREGFGNLLAEGSARVAKQIGKGADQYLITVKNTEAPAHMPQAKKALSLVYAVNPFGADHQSSEHDPLYEEGAGSPYFDRLALLGLSSPQPAYSMNEEKVRFAYITECFYSALDSFGLCQFVWGPAWTAFGPQEIVEMIQAATGWDFTLEEFLRVGERRINMMRAFNAREGFDRHADKLPAKFHKPLQGSGPTAGVAIDPEELESHKDLYYQLAGWDIASGTPPQSKLDSLGLSWFVV